MKKEIFSPSLQKRNVNKVKSNKLLIWVISLHGLAFQNKLKDFEPRKRGNQLFYAADKKKISTFQLSLNGNNLTAYLNIWTNVH